MPTQSSIRISFRDEVFDREDFSRGKTRQFNAVNSTFTRCDFTGLRADEVIFGGGGQLSTYIECTFDGMAASGTGADFAIFENCSFRNVKIRNWECRSVEIIDTTFSGKLRKCRFFGRFREDFKTYLGRENIRFFGNDFSACAFEQVEFGLGIDLSAQTLPRGPGYLWLPNLTQAIEALERNVGVWGESHPPSAASLLATLRRQADEGFTETFENVKELEAWHGPSAPHAIAFLRHRGLGGNLQRA